MDKSVLWQNVQTQITSKLHFTSKEQATFLQLDSPSRQFSVSAHSPPQEINISGALSRQMCGGGLDSDGWDGKEPLETWEQ